MTAYSSTCQHKMFECNPYAHVHCTRCNEILPAIGGGGDDGRGIDGYETESGAKVHLCAECGEYTCCGPCASCEAWESQPCRTCREPIGKMWRDLNSATVNGVYISLGPDYLVCGSCAVVAV